MTFPTCSFCRLDRPGGVAGPTPDVYICPACIELAKEIIEVQGSIGQEPPDTPEG